MPDAEICPVCQGRKNHRMQLCPDCAEIYGNTRGEWPAWLRFLVNDDSRQLYAWRRSTRQEYEIPPFILDELVGALDNQIS